MSRRLSADRTAYGLGQRAVAAQESFLVGVENRHKGDFGEVKALTEKIDSDKHIEFSRT